MISQEYFDELCIENYELFDMNDVNEAVHETIHQIVQQQQQVQQQSNNTSTTSNSDHHSNAISFLKHLTLTYPNNENGIKIRNQIRIFKESLHELQQYQIHSQDEKNENHVTFISTTTTGINNNDENDQKLLHIQDAIQIIYNYLFRNSKDDEVDVDVIVEEDVVATHDDNDDDEENDQCRTTDHDDTLNTNHHDLNTSSNATSNSSNNNNNNHNDELYIHLFIVKDGLSLYMNLLCQLIDTILRLHHHQEQGDHEREGEEDTTRNSKVIIRIQSILEMILQTIYNLIIPYSSSISIKSNHIHNILSIYQQQFVNTNNISFVQQISKLLQYYNEYNNNNKNNQNQNLEDCIDNIDTTTTKTAATSISQNLQQQQEQQSRNNNNIIVLLYSIIYFSILHNETNKRLWIAATKITTIASSSFVGILIDTLKYTIIQHHYDMQYDTTIMNHNDDDDDDTTTNRIDTTTTTKTNSNNKIQCLIYRIIVSLCTFDDFYNNHNNNNNNSNNDNLPTVQSGCTAVQALQQVNTIQIIHEHLQKLLLLLKSDSKYNNNTIVLAYMALRSMAIQDDIVQYMYQIGIIDIAVTLFQNIINSIHNHDNDTNNENITKNHSSQQLITILIGLFRNISANDEIKTVFCIGKYKSVINNTIIAMEMYPKNMLLQEHACGLFAAMSLRQPKNAIELVIQHNVQYYITLAMQYHPLSITVQRQAALAIRNIVSRSPELRPILLQQQQEQSKSNNSTTNNNNNSNMSDIEISLRTIAGKHLQCQDEVYAALRDLGLSISSVHVVKHYNNNDSNDNDQETITIETGRMMFGTRNPNFRPEYTTSL